MKIKIQSISDIITNSSSEVYTILKDDAVESVKRIIDSILALAGHGFHWNDFFKIEEGFDEDDARRFHEEVWENNEHEEGEEYEEPSYNELLDFVHEANEEAFNSGDGQVIETYLKFISIDPDSKASAALLHKLNDLFDAQVVYN